MPLDLDNWPPTDSAIHLCIDMQNIFAPGGPWPTPWLPRVLPAVEEIAGRFPDRTPFHHAAAAGRHAGNMAPLLYEMAGSDAQ